ncbi:unnamed protein product [marine sediment metagenome]|uniref:Uncharacterized protein n=1 Tax=marine sediment metagenome TaxID=412755 RepID=X0S0J1_9ZZZZ
MMAKTTPKAAAGKMEPPAAYMGALTAVLCAKDMTDTDFWQEHLFATLKAKVESFRASCMSWDNPTRQEAQMYHEVLGDITSCVRHAIQDLNDIVRDIMLKPLFDYGEIFTAKMDDKKGSIELIPVVPKGKAPAAAGKDAK